MLWRFILIWEFAYGFNTFAPACHGDNENGHFTRIPLPGNIRPAVVEIIAPVRFDSGVVVVNALIKYRVIQKKVLFDIFSIIKTG